MTVRRRSGLVTAVAKMADEDPETAALFVQLSLFNTLADLAEEARPVLDVDGERVMAHGAEVAKRRLLQVSKSMDDEQVEEAAIAVMVLDAYLVNKGLFGDALHRFNEMHTRDDKGRFVHMKVDNSGQANGSEESRVENAHRKVKNMTSNLERTGLIDKDTPVRVHYSRLDKDTGRMVDGPPTHFVDTKHGSLDKDTEAFRLEASRNKDKLIPHSISFDRRGIPDLGGKKGEQRRAALDAMLTFAGPERAESIGRLARAIPADKTQTEWAQIASDWNRPGEWDDRKVYRRMQLTGEALASATVPGTAANTVGNLARLTGQLGPEAEKVLGPGMRRTAYRYRGTERRPREAMMRQNERATQRADEVISPDQNAPAKIAMARELATGSTDASTGSAAWWMSQQNRNDPEPLSSDQVWLRTHGDTAAIAMVDERLMPDMNAAALSLQSGEQPPSVGVIIDADGDLVSQSQGYNGDHYLPFDLKNLKALQGGQYVRTRAAGGLTSEDLYTGLLAGARQVQAVSNSGVFTIEFDPSIRGGRRYSDKALRMINRYGKILETIESGKIVTSDIDQAQRQELMARARQIAPSKDKVNEYFQNLLEEERTNQEGPDEDELLAEAKMQVDRAARSSALAGEPKSKQWRAAAVDETFKELRQQFQNKQVKRLALDGEGYSAAMAALKQEFPFYIRSALYEPLPIFLARRGQKPQGQPRGPRDRGYVERGQTNAKAAVGAPRYDLRREIKKPESVGDQGAVDERAGGGAGAGAGIRRSASGKILEPGESETVPITQAIKQPKIQRATVKNVANLVVPTQKWAELPNVAAIEPDFYKSDDDAMGEAPPRYLWYRLTKVAKNNSQAFTTWLLNDAKPDQLQAIHESVTELEHVISNEKDPQVQESILGMPMDKWATDVAAPLRTVIEAAQPWEDKTAGQDWETARPNVDHPRPQQIPAVIALGDDVDSYDQFIERTARANPSDDFGQLVKDTRNLTPEDHFASLDEMADELEKQTPGSNGYLQQKHFMEMRQLAWAVNVGRNIAENLRELRGDTEAEASGAGPKVHKSDSPTFARSVLDLAERLHRSEPQ